MARALFPLPTQEFGGYNLFFKFSEGSVTVASEIESNPSITETSLYSLGEDLGVTLNFDTKNSLINYFVHPKNPDNIGSTYKGMEGDYKFTVMETSAAMVVLRGIITGNYYILTPFPRTPTGRKTWRPTGTMRKTCHSTPIPSS